MPIFILVVLVFVGLTAPWIAPYDPIEQSLRGRNAPPTWWDSGFYEENPGLDKQFFFGADHVGRDVLSRVIHGAQISLMVAAISLSTGIVLGTAFGIAAGWYGGIIDEIMMRIVDVWLALPFLLLALIITMLLGQSFWTLMGLLALLAWSAGVRNIRAEVLSLKERDYVALARISGASTMRMVMRHIVPGVVNTVVVLATLRVGQLILAEAALSFLGAGIPAPTPSWGLIINEGREYLDVAWWIAFFPGLAIFLLVMALNFLGDWLRDRMDPRLRQF
ncbi:MAG: ABC transporter permease [Chloroflexota bacterium]